MHPHYEAWLQCGEHDIQTQEQPGRVPLAPIHLLSRPMASVAARRGRRATEVAR